MAAPSPSQRIADFYRLVRARLENDLPRLPDMERAELEAVLWWWVMTHDRLLGTVPTQEHFVAYEPDPDFAAWEAEVMDMINARLAACTSQPAAASNEAETTNIISIHGRATDAGPDAAGTALLGGLWESISDSPEENTDEEHDDNENAVTDIPMDECWELEGLG
ncbi:MAG: hypothetical protein EA402_12540 [Planctomycetota bacterium]|nr:MAG: hypothetical protein EA402_12540 [Planctomycetota bacterium]